MYDPFENPSPPDRADQEWINASTHALATLVAVVAGCLMVASAAEQSLGLTTACAAYALSVVATFTFSTLSHVFTRQPLLDRMRAWDQAMIYTMISGTYTPIAYRFLDGTPHLFLQSAIWLAAFAGVATKLLFRHRVNSITTIGYLLLGWLPAVVLFRQVPGGLAWMMLFGGIVYSLGVAVLINDHKHKYFHAVWHLMVMMAAAMHYWGIFHYVVGF